MHQVSFFPLFSPSNLGLACVLLCNYSLITCFSERMSADCVKLFQTATLLWTTWSWTSRKCWNWERRRQTPQKSSATRWRWTRSQLETSECQHVTFLSQSLLYKLNLFYISPFPPSGPQITTSCRKKAVSIPPNGSRRNSFQVI